MISDPILFVQCDRCDAKAEFTFALVLDKKRWQEDVRFNGWYIDWSGVHGKALCPTHRAEAESE